MESMHLSFISSFGDDDNSEPAICSRRNDDTMLNKYFDSDESKERGDVAAKESTDLHLAQACGIQVPGTGLLGTSTIPSHTSTGIELKSDGETYNRRLHKIGTSGNDNMYTCWEWGR